MLEPNSDPWLNFTCDLFQCEHQTRVHAMKCFTYKLGAEIARDINMSMPRSMHTYQYTYIYIYILYMYRLSLSLSLSLLLFCFVLFCFVVVTVVLLFHFVCLCRMLPSCIAVWPEPVWPQVALHHAGRQRAAKEPLSNKHN